VIYFIYFPRSKSLKIIWTIQPFDQGSRGKSCCLKSCAKINNNHQTMTQHCIVASFVTIFIALKSKSSSKVNFYPKI